MPCVSHLVTGSCKVSHIEHPIRMDDVFGAASCHKDTRDVLTHAPSSSGTNDTAVVTYTRADRVLPSHVGQADESPIVSHSASPPSRPQMPAISHSSSHTPAQEGIVSEKVGGQNILRTSSSSAPNNPHSDISNDNVSSLPSREAPQSYPSKQCSTAATRSDLAGGSKKGDYTSEDLNRLLCKIAEMTRRLTSARVCGACYTLNIPYNHKNVHDIQGCRNNYGNERDAAYFEWRKALKYKTGFCWGCCYTNQVSH